jgi:hypothetical protein
MLVAYRLAGLSALGAHYAGVKWRVMRGFHNMPLRPLPRHAPDVSPGGRSTSLRQQVSHPHWLASIQGANTGFQGKVIGP